MIYNSNLKSLISVRAASVLRGSKALMRQRINVTFLTYNEILQVFV